VPLYDVGAEIDEKNLPPRHPENCRAPIRLAAKYLADGRNTPAARQITDVKIHLREKVVPPAARRKTKQ